MNISRLAKERAEATSQIGPHLYQTLKAFRSGMVVSLDDIVREVRRHAELCFYKGAEFGMDATHKVYLEGNEKVKQLAKPARDESNATPDVVTPGKASGDQTEGNEKSIDADRAGLPEDAYLADTLTRQVIEQDWQD